MDRYLASPWAPVVLLTLVILAFWAINRWDQR